MEEKELIKLAKEGNEKALDELYAKYKQKVLNIAKKYYLNDGNNDDIVQEGMLGFLKAINTYTEGKSEFGYYMKRLVEQQIINAIKKSNSHKNAPLNERYNLNNQGELEFGEEEIGIPNESLSPESEVIQEENTAELNSIMNSKLSEFEQQVLQLYLCDFTYYDIMEKLQVTYKSVDNALQRIKLKLQNLKGE